MFKRTKRKSKQVAVYRPLVLDREASRAHPYMPELKTVHAALTIIEDLFMIITASLVLVLLLELGNISNNAHIPARVHHKSKRSEVARLLSSEYDIRPSKNTATVSADPLFRTKPARITSTGCSGRTIMNVVAHQDDDLLFINPDIAKDLRQHDCVRTVYVTAGDDGRGTDYLLSREAGSEAAYSTMINSTEPWAYQQLKLSSGITVTTASPEDNVNVTLTFLRLPDGNLDGSGFPDTGNESIAKLKAGSIPTITSVDGQVTYTSAQLTDTLTALMRYYAPIRINTQSNDMGLAVVDHSDHIATGQYATAAAKSYEQVAHRTSTGLVHYYMGYPIRAMAPNLSTVEASEKAAVFFAYAAHDPGVCTSMEQCVETGSTYGLYLSRLYTSNQ